MKRTTLIAVTLLLSWGDCPADTIYLLGGKKIEGKVIANSEGKVRIRTAEGVEVVDEVDVLYVARGTTAPEGQTPDASDGDTAAAPDETLVDRTLEPDFTGRRKTFALSEATRGDCAVFLLMRTKIPGATSLTVSDADGQIERWRATAKDRKRRAGARWLEPDDFIRMRESYVEELRRAQELYRRIGAEARRLSATHRRTVTPNYRRAFRAQADAATNWPDPVLRNFLVGVAEIHAGDFQRARAFFSRAVGEGPRVAAFHQGLAIAELGNDRPLDALPGAMELVRLRPAARETLELLKWAVEEVPGSQIQHPLYLQAKETLDALSKKQSTSSRAGSRQSPTTNWLLPGRSVTARENELPTPPFDRLVFRQAVGVPVTEDTLLVDTQAVGKAAQIYVRLGPDRLVPAGARRRSARSRNAGSAPPLSLVTIKEKLFTPLEADPEKSVLKPNEVVALVGLSLYEQMQRIPRVTGAVVDEIDANGRPKADLSLWPGEAAGPLLTADGRLIGILAGRTDPFAEGGGPDRFIGLGDLSGLLRRSPYAGGILSGGRRRGDNADADTGEKLKSRYFVVYAVHGERFVERLP